MDLYSFLQNIITDNGNQTLMKGAAQDEGLVLGSFATFSIVTSGFVKDGFGLAALVGPAFLNLLFG